MRRIIVVVPLIFIFSIIFAQPQVPFKKGINLTGWFQASNVGGIQFGKYSYEDFKDIKSLGVDVIRLPINLHFMTDGEPNYIIEPLFFQFLDTVVMRCEKLDMHLILDNHTFDPAIDTDPEVGVILKKVWAQMAQRYRDKGLVYYEILNEPHGIDDDVWNTIQGEVIDEIRMYDTNHTIIVGPANWNSYNHLEKMPNYEDDNLIYTFHFYDPFLLSHQGAGWIDPSMDEVRNIPFPYAEDSMPLMPEIYKDTWIETRYNEYSKEGTKDEVERLLDIAFDFSKERNVPVFCGEFGIMMNYCENQARVNWYEVVCDYLSAQNIGWTAWDYHHLFGVFENGEGYFDYDLNVELLEAMSFDAPLQTTYEKSPDSEGFSLYTDFVDNNMVTTSWGISWVNYYCENEPNNDRFCMEMNGMPQYSPISFNFRLEKDLSALNADNYAIDFMIRCNRPSTPIDIRFVDTYILDDEDIPWRMHVTINDNYYKGDLAWHHVHIPLSSFKEMGGHDGEWHNPIGAFDWSAIDKFEIVTETEVGDATFWFDNIHITNLDTALVYNQVIMEDPYPKEEVGVNKNINNGIHLFPNPSQGSLTISLPNADAGKLQVFDMQGQLVISKSFSAKSNLPMDLSTLNPGVYLLELNGMQKKFTERVYLIP